MSIFRLFPFILLNHGTLMGLLQVNDFDFVLNVHSNFNAAFNLQIILRKEVLHLSHEFKLTALWDRNSLFHNLIHIYRGNQFFHIFILNTICWIDVNDFLHFSVSSERFRFSTAKSLPEA